VELTASAAQIIVAGSIQTLCPERNVKTDSADGEVPHSVPKNCSPVFAALVKSKVRPSQTTENGSAALGSYVNEPEVGATPPFVVKSIS
jgi:hypothetical protein